MRQAVGIMMHKEWKAFLGSDRSVFILYGIVVVLWSFLFVGAEAGQSPMGASLWLLPFSVIVVSNFAQGVFVSERLTGSIEILLTCGLSRRAVMGGKMLFVWISAVVMGLVCMGLGSLWAALAVTAETGVGLGPTIGGHHILLFIAATGCNTALVALFSIFLPNPRMSHLLNFLVMAVVMGGYLPLATRVPEADWILGAVLLLGALAGVVGVFRGAAGERIARPVSM